MDIQSQTSPTSHRTNYNETLKGSHPADVNCVNQSKLNQSWSDSYRDLEP